ncbi:hypothetical protein FW774_09090 [Pedobacter sp. BS3]|uniref:hypothetical protein n=1 Tax=Pedobacter sp. BS3 TaxID=2567937 RepID=UPI0011EE6914|nr:hypothetical protein [Pedobacter sp. BS3]TZF83621.1 hypothetical protein FW774_09090 [Pedobacter sp. BS3]
MKYLIWIIISLVLVSCNSSIKPELLYGRWHYVKVEYLNNPEAKAMDAQEVAANKPYIEFSRNGDLIMVWNGKVLSHGKYTIADNLIRYQEILDGGRIREFPFLVQKLTPDELVFQNMEQQSTRVTAKK